MVVVAGPSTFAHTSLLCCELQYCDIWRQVSDAVSLVDVLLSLRTFAGIESSRGPLCLPQFVTDSTC